MFHSIFISKGTNLEGELKKVISKLLRSTLSFINKCKQIKHVFHEKWGIQSKRISALQTQNSLKIFFKLIKKISDIDHLQNVAKKMYFKFFYRNFTIKTKR